jgi:hypothetical protein
MTMARMSTRAKTKNIVAKKSARKKSLTAVQNNIMYGDEPKFKTGESYRMYQLQLFNWMNHTFELTDYKNEFLKYAKNNNYNVEDIKNLSDYDFISVGKVSYMYNNDRYVDDTLNEYFDNKLLDLIDSVIAKEEDNKKTNDFDEEKLSAHDKNRLSYVDFYSDMERYINDDNPEEKFQEIIAKRPNIQVLKMLENHFQSSVEDWKNSVETFSKRDKSDLKQKFEKYLKNSELALKIVNSSLINLENAKSANRKPRKTRTPKKIPASKLIEKLSYKKEDKEFNLVSINPENIIGAKTLLVFNTKTRKFGYFHAQDANGLSVKGTSILNYNETTSLCKTLRKPSEQIPELTGSTVKRMETQFANIKAVSTNLKSRMNEDILLLKIYR